MSSGTIHSMLHVGQSPLTLSEPQHITKREKKGKPNSANSEIHFEKGTAAEVLCLSLLINTSYYECLQSVHLKDCIYFNVKNTNVIHKLIYSAFNITDLKLGYSL